MLLPNLLHAEESTECRKDVLGITYCPPPGGTIVENALGIFECGRGHCMKDNLGLFHCSNERGGYVSTNAFNMIICTGGCVYSSMELCKPLY